MPRSVSLNYIAEIKDILAKARESAYRAVQSQMVSAYWQIGQRIVEEEQRGSERVQYGKEIIKTLAAELTREFGRGFSARSLREMRQFYLYFQDIEKWRTVFATLGWSHFQRVLKVQNEQARLYYLREAAENHWSVRTLDRNIATLYYDRLLASGKPETQAQDPPMRAEDFIKNPAVLEFLQLPASFAYSEADLEKALIDNLQHFLLELGKGFAFVARQQHIRTETSDFYIDLVFYNYILRCFVIIELKTDKLTHQDIGQLDMYVRMYDDLRRQPGDNPTIGLLLCTETDGVVARYSVLHDNPQLFAGKYIHYLPSEEELVREIEHQRQLFAEHNPQETP